MDNEWLFELRSDVDDLSEEIQELHRKIDESWTLFIVIAITCVIVGMFIGGVVIA